LAGALDEYRVDLMIGHWFSYDLGTLISEAARRHIPFAAVHHFDNKRLGFARTRRWLRQSVMLGGVSSLGVPAEVQAAFVNLSDAVDTEFFAPQAFRPISRPKGHVILLPARIIAGKGHDDLLFCAKRLAEAGVDFTVVFAGAVDSPPFRDELEGEIGSHGLRNHVVFAGELSPEELRDWYAASDLVVLPSYFEGLGRVLLEAQAMERPVIAYDSGGVPEAVIPGETGLLVKRGDRKALASGIQSLCEHPAERQKMGSCGRRFVMSRFSMPALVERHERFCLTSLQSPRLARQENASIL
jgi:glycosyltransferase involved in cell wall biosynthesis